MAINKFGIAAVRNAWYDSKKVTDEDISGYTKVIFFKSSVFLFVFGFGEHSAHLDVVPHAAIEDEGLG